MDTIIPEVACIDPAEFVKALSGWSTDAESASVLDKGRGRKFFRACRIAAGVEWSSADTHQWEFQQAVARQYSITMVAPVAPPPTPPTVIAAVKVSDVADVIESTEVTAIDKNAVDIMWARHFRSVHADPGVEGEPTQEQLSGLANQPENCSCYVDFALWGPHGKTAQKTQKFVGMLFGPGGKLMMQEFRGPPDCEHWSA